MAWWEGCERRNGIIPRWSREKSALEGSRHAGTIVTKKPRQGGKGEPPEQAKKFCTGGRSARKKRKQFLSERKPKKEVLKKA